MKTNSEPSTGPKQESDKPNAPIQSNSSGQYDTKSVIYTDTEKDLNSKILKITMMIQEEFPELSKYLEEMPVTVPNSTRPFVQLHHLKKYYDSLSALLSRYRLEHPKPNQH